MRLSNPACYAAMPTLSAEGDSPEKCGGTLQAGAGHTSLPSFDFLPDHIIMIMIIISAF